MIAVKHVISISDFSKQDILSVLAHAKNFEAKNLTRYTDKVMASLFFEPSTRTKLSFQTAMERLGGKVIGFDDTKKTSLFKGETLFDTLKMMEKYADIIVMRHNIEGAARFASEIVDVPVINAGDGANQHPTQTILDLYTIQKKFKKIDGLSLAMVGDLKYGRTVHSLITALKHFDVKIKLIAPKQLAMPEEFKKGLSVEENENLNVSDVDILYVTRIQKERFADPLEYQRLKGMYIIDSKVCEKMKKGAIIMHPLPRVGEITPDVDKTPFAKYFEQAANGVPTRMAIIDMLLTASQVK